MNTRRMVRAFIPLSVLLVLLAAWTTPSSKPVAKLLLQGVPTPTTMWANKVDPSPTPEPNATLDVTVTVPITQPVATADVTVAAPTTEPMAVHAALAQPGTNPNLAQVPAGAWTFIPPNTTHWYRMDDAGFQLNIWLDANGASGLAFVVYAPEQTDLYGKPIGRGSFNKFIPEHDLYWTGYTSAGGTWYAAVTNSSPSALPYLLNYKRTINSTAGQCAACHGFNIEWNRCQDNGGTFCNDLQKSYNGH